jgi:PiT family inorganic phosphate transporter
VIGLLLLTLLLTMTLGGSDNAYQLPLLLSANIAALYLALNIGANDAANHVGILVGAGALSLGSALLIAAGGEIAGALLASNTVSARLRDDLLHNDLLTAGGELAVVLLAGMLAAGLWLHIATVARVPVSTTHSIVGGLVGAGISVGGWQIVQWENIGLIATVWIASPIAGALAAAAVFMAMERLLTYRSNPIVAARTRIPLLVALLALLMADHYFRELSPPHWPVNQHPFIASLAVAVLVFLLVQPLVYSASQNLKNNRQGLNQLLTKPLIFTAFFFAFAHGANDVANVTAPLTALASTALQGSTPGKFAVPPWVLLLSVAGIALGIVTYGHRVVRTVGKGITDLDRLRAFSIAISAVLVISLATQFGYPVSTTHILVGGILGVGLMREWNHRHEQEVLARIRKSFSPDQTEEMNRFVHRFESATRARQAEMLEQLFQGSGGLPVKEKDLIKLHASHHLLIRPRQVGRIVAFWVVTTPSAGLLGAGMATLIPRLV